MPPILPRLLAGIALACCLGFPPALFANPSRAPLDSKGGVARYNVVWESPSKDACGSMPLGNGDLSSNVYSVEKGDLFLLMSKGDAFTGNGDLNKTGWVKIHLEPNPFAKGKAFRQTLDLPTGSISIEADGVQIRIWVDANRPVYRVDIDSPRQIAVTAEPEFWKRRDNIEDQKLIRPDRILWYHANGEKTCFLEDLKHYEVEHMAATYPDPFAHNTYGGLLDGTGMKVENGRLSGKGSRFALRIHSIARQVKDPNQWLAELEKLATRPASPGDWEAHCQWWSAFWERSWIRVSDNSLPADQREKALPPPDQPAWKEALKPRPAEGERATDVPLHLRQEPDGGFVVAQCYQLQRFMMACQSRGPFQAHFSGGNFTMPIPDKTGTSIAHVDSRLWARGYTFQNQRLMYWPMLAAGDTDLIQPIFNYYFSMLELRKAITKAWFGHDGAFYRENTMRTGQEHDATHPFKLEPGKEPPKWFCDYYKTPDGKLDLTKVGKPPKVGPGPDAPRNYHNYYFTCGLELSAMMLEYYRQTGDEKFRNGVLLPFAREIVTFFDKHWGRNAQGKFHIDPGQALETWWRAVNPLPDIAGLEVVLDGLLQLKGISETDRKQWERFRSELPPIPTRQIDGKTALAPADEFLHVGNGENPELYAIFPFKLFGTGRRDLDWAGNALQARRFKGGMNDSCWIQDEIHLAYVGQADEAQVRLENRFRQYSPFCRFVGFPAAKADGCPDFDHNGSGSIALQSMLIQEAEGKIYLLPAWPSNWDADFKLHASTGTVVSGKVKDGALREWSVAPESRRNDVVLLKPQTTGIAKVAEEQGLDPKKIISILRKPSSQSSDWDASHTASKANDGNVAGEFNKCACTRGGPNAWWQVDLEQVRDIGMVVLFNRTDAAPERLSNFHILVSETPFGSGALAEVQKQPGVVDRHFKEGGTPVTKVPINARGRYVRLQLDGPNRDLHFAEMMIEGL